MAGCQVKLTREGESERLETQSQRPFHSFSGPWTAEERPGWGRSALTGPRPLTTRAGASKDPQPSRVLQLAPCSATCPPWPSHIPWPQAGLYQAMLTSPHPHVSPFPLLRPSQNLCPPSRWGWKLHPLLTPLMALCSTQSPTLPPLPS